MTAAELVGAIEAAEDDADALQEVLDVLEVRLPDLSPEEARMLHDAIGEAVLRVQARHDAVASELGGVRVRSRAVRGFGRAVRYGALLKGQRVNRGV